MGSKIYGLFFYCFGFAAVLVYLIQFYLVDVIGYEGLFLIMGFLSVVAFGILIFYNEELVWRPKAISQLGVEFYS